MMLQFVKLVSREVTASCVSLKQDPALLAGASIIGGLINHGLQQNENQRSRDFAASESQKQRAWAEKMYTTFNTPSAQMHMMRNAGLNPYLLERNGQVATGNAPTDSSTYNPVSMNAGQLNFPDAVGSYLQARVVDANIANQQQETISRGLDNFTKALERGLSYDDASKILNMSVGSFNRNGELDYAMRSIEQDFIRRESEAAMAKFSAYLKQRYGEKEVQNVIANQEQEFSRMAAEIGKMASDVKVNEAEISKKASELARNYADANHLRADAATIDAIRNAMADKYRNEAAISGYERGESEAEFTSRNRVRNFMRTKEGQYRRLKHYQYSPEGNVASALITRTSKAIRGK